MVATNFNGRAFWAEELPASEPTTAKATIVKVVIRIRLIEICFIEFLHGEQLFKIDGRMLRHRLARVNGGVQESAGNRLGNSANRVFSSHLVLFSKLS
jgi:hypothetical protein